ncbi:MAG TPA: hypothetical protein VFB03_03675 [Candidatus Saccharimonadales bacterium]|nr:hypothetical protein [Candidatus Saccharimonadales bacterium]
MTSESLSHRFLENTTASYYSKMRIGLSSMPSAVYMAYHAITSESLRVGVESGVSAATIATLGILQFRNGIRQWRQESGCVPAPNFGGRVLDVVSSFKL